MRFCVVALALVSALLASETSVFATAAEHSGVLSSINDNNFEATAKRSLRSHDTAVEEERGLDADKLLKLMNPDDITAALKNYDDEIALFAKWWQHEDDVVNKLMEMPNRIKNMPILTKFNDFRTSMHYDQVLTPWLSTKDLDEVATAIRAFKMKLSKEQFNIWYKSGVKPTELSEAIAKVENPLRRKGYGALENHYKWYVNGEAIKTARAAAKKVEEFAAKRAQAKKLAEAAAKRAQEIKTQKEMAKKIADAAAKAAAKRTTDVQARNALAKKIAEAAAKRDAELKAKSPVAAAAA